MSLVFPFKALRPAKSFARQVAAPPYDVMSFEEAKKYVHEKPLCFLHVEKSEIDISDAEGVDDPRIYERAKANLQGLIGKGVLQRDKTPAFYLYRQRLGTVCRLGSWPASVSRNTKPGGSGGTS